jgi:hypothetical protein
MGTDSSAAAVALTGARPESLARKWAAFQIFFLKKASIPDSGQV